jgi:tetratricopeptide (TPR) repeat protein
MRPPKSAEEAVAAYREALKERRQERVPLDWAMTQNNLGTALWTLGERESGTARLEEALTAIESAHRVYRAAGLLQYESDFERRLQSLRQLIAQRFQ